MFKDLKQIFRKEQCDASLLLTANIPSAKKIIVHGPDGADAGGIPSQVCYFNLLKNLYFIIYFWQLILLKCFLIGILLFALVSYSGRHSI